AGLGGDQRAVVHEAEGAGNALGERCQHGDDVGFAVYRGSLAPAHAPTYSRRSAAVGQLAGPQLAGELVEHAVDDPGFVAGKEGVRDVDILADDHAGRHVAELHQLKGGGAQDRADDRVDAIEAPAFGELAVDQRIDLALAPHDPLQHPGEVLGIGVTG